MSEWIAISHKKLREEGKESNFLAGVCNIFSGAQSMCYYSQLDDANWGGDLRRVAIWRNDDA